MSAQTGTKTRVAIIGGGPSALAAAFELTATPELEARHEITIYQPGWRLGGKCASGRNQDRGSRIEEHGLHVWFGCYDNAFSIIRRCYAELESRPEALQSGRRVGTRPGLGATRDRLSADSGCPGDRAQA